MGAEVYHALKAVLHGRGLATAVGDEGGFAPDLPSSEAAIEAILEATEQAGSSGEASRSRSTRPRARSSRTATTASRAARLAGAEMPAFWADLLGRYPIVSLEDGLAEDDWEPGRSSRPSSVTAAARRRRHLRHEPGAPRGAASPSGVANSILIKVNQIGTLTETLEAIRLAQARRLHRGHLAPLGRDRGRDDRRPRRRHGRGPDQDGRAGELGARRQVQPAPAHRGGARRCAPIIPAWARFRGLALNRRSGPFARLSMTVEGQAERRSSPRSGLRRLAREGCAPSSRPEWTRLASTSRTARTTTTARARGSCAQVQAELGRPARADRRPPGPEAPARRR